MIYLLDVNALLALGCVKHVHHGCVQQWLQCVQERADEQVRLATCAITELGFVRVASGRAALIESVGVARAELRHLKARSAFIFLGDELDADQLPHWVTKSSQTTDGHLLELAAAHGARLATFDRGIPCADLIETATRSELMVKEPTVRYGAHLVPAGSGLHIAGASRGAAVSDEHFRADGFGQDANRRLEAHC